MRRMKFWNIFVMAFSLTFCGSVFNASAMSKTPYNMQPVKKLSITDNSTSTNDLSESKRAQVIQNLLKSNLPESEKTRFLKNLMGFENEMGEEKPIETKDVFNESDYAENKLDTSNTQKGKVVFKGKKAKRKQRAYEKKLREENRVNNYKKDNVIKNIVPINKENILERELNLEDEEEDKKKLNIDNIKINDEKVMAMRDFVNFRENKLKSIANTSSNITKLFEEQECAMKQQINRLKKEVDNLDDVENKIQLIDKYLKSEKPTDELESRMGQIVAEQLIEDYYRDETEKQNKTGKISLHDYLAKMNINVNLNDSYNKNDKKLKLSEIRQRLSERLNNLKNETKKLSNQADQFVTDTRNRVIEELLGMFYSK